MLERMSPASPFHCGPGLGLAFCPSSHPARSILFPYGIFPAALMFSPDRQRPSVPGGRCWRISHLLLLLGNGRVEPVPSFRFSSTDCRQPGYVQHQQFSNLSIHQNRLQGLLVHSYPGPTPAYVSDWQIWNEAQ